MTERRRFLATASGGDYPREELDRLWKLLLLQQFHDVLPGSSVGLVYEDAERDLAEVEAGARALCVPGDALVNTIGFARRELVGDGMVEAAKTKDRKPLAVDGYEDAGWILLDFDSVLAHVFLPGERSYYDLESLWAPAAKRRRKAASA